MMKQEPNSKINDNENKSEVYWRTMYEELELQMYNMMEMTLELIDKEAGKGSFTHKKMETNLDIPKNFQQEFRRLKLFEHRIKVTWLGKLTLKYIALKKKIKSLIKR